MKTVFKCLSLMGDQVAMGISAGMLSVFTPKWGMNRRQQSLAAIVTSDHEEKIMLAYVAVVDGRPAVFRAEDDLLPQAELVLVQEYEPGVGAKRWPSFEVEFGSGCRILSEAQTSGGSGWERHILVSAPLKWAENIASQFVDRRDEPGQVISFKKVKGNAAAITAMAAALLRLGGE